MPDTDSTFGDADPEDAYDATDPVKDRLDVLERVVDSLDANRTETRFDARRTDALRLVANLHGHVDLNQREKRRLKKIREALEEM